MIVRSIKLSFAILFITCSTICANAQVPSSTSPTPEWGSAGNGLSDDWYQPLETVINVSNARSLVRKWVFTTGGDVSATPTENGGVVYFPDWAGNLYAVNSATGTLRWSHKIADYDGLTGSVSRSSPVISGNILIIGDHTQQVEMHAGTNVIAINRSTGALLWKTLVEPHQAAIITGSPVVANGVVYVGVSSYEEAFAKQSSYACCTFRGSVVALNVNTGRKLWQTYVVPDNFGNTGGYSGGAIWQPAAIDLTRKLLYIGTGNNYSVPASVELCEQSGIRAGKVPNCTAANDHFDSALALNLADGSIKWATKTSRWDATNEACGSASPPPNCPSPAGSDIDLGGDGPNLVGNLVVFGQKNGYLRAYNADTGKLVWATVVGPGGDLGGILWGTASDGKRIYVPIGNSKHQSYRLTPSGVTITWGAWSALDALTGKILWQTADPIAGSLDVSSASVANGVLFVGSLDRLGHMYALNAATGAVLWSYASGGSVIDAPSIVNGTLFWGSGYRRYSGNGATGNHKVYAFALPGH
jgi:polyvinyl alcohol dehydrogenase (cytochrome)